MLATAMITALLCMATNALGIDVNIDAAMTSSDNSVMYALPEDGDTIVNKHLHRVVVPLKQLTQKDSISIGPPAADNLNRHHFNCNIIHPSLSAASLKNLEANLGVIYNSDNLQVNGNVNTTAFPSMMNKATGTLGAALSTERSTFYFGGIVNKYAFHGGLFRQFGLSARFCYMISAPLSVTAFAYYYGKNALPIMPNGAPIPPSMLGFYDVSRFGGYVDYNVSEHFSITVGGQVVERHGLNKNHFDLEPIATPYIMIGKGKKKFGLGLPVGQILYGLFGR